MLRRTKMVLVATVAATMMFTGTAMATSLVYFDGYSGGLQLGPRHTLTESSVRSLDGTWACTSAYEDSDGSRAGDPYCTTDVIAHPYCACTLKLGASTDVSGHFRGREDY